MVSTQDSESCNPSSNLGGTFLLSFFFWSFLNILEEIRMDLYGIQYFRKREWIGVRLMWMVIILVVIGWSRTEMEITLRDITIFRKTGWRVKVKRMCWFLVKHWVPAIQVWRSAQLNVYRFESDSDIWWYLWEKRDECNEMTMVNVESGLWAIVLCFVIYAIISVVTYTEIVNSEWQDG